MRHDTIERKLNLMMILIVVAISIGGLSATITQSAATAPKKPEPKKDAKESDKDG